MGIVKHKAFFAMKQKLLHLQSLVAVALCVIMSMALVSCSDDDEPDGDNLAKIVVGTWAQDGDNDIFTIKADGTGEYYDRPEDYYAKHDGDKLTWKYSDGWFTLFIGEIEEGEASIDDFKMRVKSASKDKIVWKNYAPVYGSRAYDDTDAFGDYDLWTWERIE